MNEKNGFRPRRRAIAVTAALTAGMMLGATSMAAQATGIRVEGTVEPCVISINSSEPVDLGTPSYDDEQGAHVFEHDEAISVNWQADGLSCTGALHVSRTAIVLEAATAVAGEKSLTLTSFDVDGEGAGDGDGEDLRDVHVDVDVGVTPEIAREVPTASSSGGVETFGVEMVIPETSPDGLYSSILTFTVIVE